MMERFEAMVTRVLSPMTPSTKMMLAPGDLTCSAKSAVVLTVTTSPPSPPVVPFKSRSGTDAQPIGAASKTGGPKSTIAVLPSSPVGTDVGALEHPPNASAHAQLPTANHRLP